MDVMALIMRWTHIFSAGMAIGGPLFMRFVLMPAAGAVLDNETHQKLRTAVMAKWKRWVHLLILLFLASGLYMYLVVAPRWNIGPAYHMLFGMKFLAALFLFFVASALSGRLKVLAFMREHARQWLNGYVVVIVLVIVLAGVMRSVRDNVGLRVAAPAEMTDGAAATMPR